MNYCEHHLLLKLALVGFLKSDDIDDDVLQRHRNSIRLCRALLLVGTYLTRTARSASSAAGGRPMQIE